MKSSTWNTPATLLAGTTNSIRSMFGKALVRTFLALPAWALVGLSQPALAAVSPPEAVHIVCLAEQQTAFDERQQLADLEGIDELGVYLDVRVKGEARTSPETAKKYKTFMKKHVWQVQDMWARSIGTGFVVSSDRKQVLTSFDVASACPTVAEGSERNRKQIAILSSDGLRAIRGRSLGISVSAGESTPLPLYICKDKDTACSRSRPDEVKKAQLEGRSSSAGYSSLRSEVKYWSPDLALVYVDEPLSAGPVTFQADDGLASGVRLLFSGFPKAAQVAGMGTSNVISPAERAKPTVQPAVFSRMVSVDNADSQIITPDRRVKATWLELTGANIGRGNSGSPLYDATSMQVVGLVINELGSTDQKTGGKAVPVSQIFDYLKQANVKYTVAQVSPPTPVASPASAPKPASQTESVSQEKSLSELMLSWQGLAVAVTLTVLLGFFGWYVIFNSRSSRPEPEPGPVGPSLYSQESVSPPTPSMDVEARKTTALSTARLRAATGPLQGQEFFLPTASGKPTITVGANAALANVVFPASAHDVSGQHCRFNFDSHSHSVSVEDLKSTNGTYVNKQRLKDGERRDLNNGDVVSLARPGAYDFVLHID